MQNKAEAAGDLAVPQITVFSEWGRTRELLTRVVFSRISVLLSFGPFDFVKGLYKALCVEVG